jgi:hypothetical protein
MSVDRPRKVGAPVFPKKGPKLRMVKSPGERPRPGPDSELKAIIEDMNRRHRERRGRAEENPGGKDAA